MRETLFLIFLAFVYSTEGSAFVLPKPSGRFAVGVEKIRIQNKATPPEFLDLEIYYPAAGKLHSLPSAEIPENWKAWYLKRLGTAAKVTIDEPVFDWVIPNAPIANKPKEGVPLIIFRPGYTAGLFSYHSIVEELVSHGFGVMMIANELFLPFLSKRAESVIHGSEDEASSDLTQNLWVQDTEAALDYLRAETEAEGHKFYHFFNLNKIGAIGHSFGGSTALQLARNNPVILAGINLDGAIYGKGAEIGFSKPIMVLQGGESIEIYRKKDDATLSKEYSQTLADTIFQRKCYCEKIPILIKTHRSDAYSFKINSAGHSAFGDTVLFKQSHFFQQHKKDVFSFIEERTGPITGPKMSSILRTLVTSFFKKYLQDQDIDINKMRHTFPEVQNSSEGTSCTSNK